MPHPNLKKKAPAKKAAAPKKKVSAVSAIQKRYPKHTVKQIKGANRYRLTDSSGHSVTLSPGNKSKNPGKTVKKAIEIKNKKKKK